MPTATVLSNTNARVSAFSFEGADVRVLNRSDEPWWVLTDVCDVLSIANPRNVSAKLDEDEKGVQIVDTLGGPQETTIINESGLYSLILTSRKPAAKRFKKWVTAEVLPAIRKTGGYIAAAPEETVEQLTLRVMTVLKDTVERQKQQIESMAPKAEALDLISASEGDLGVRDAGRELKVGERWVTATILARNWACKQGRKLRPAHYGLMMGYVRLCARVYRDRNTGETCVADDFKITRKGVGRLGELIVAKRLSNVEAV